jgi:VanZ family protein
MAVILVAGLWPFGSPKNEVAWLDSDNGLRFGRHGVVLSSVAMPPPAAGTDASRSLEIWLEPHRSKGRETILSLEGSERARAPFVLQQNGDKIVIQRLNVDEEGNPHVAELTVGGGLAKKPVFVTVTLGGQETSLYIDGVEASTSTISGRTSGDFSGRLVLGDSVTGSNSWSGRIRGLAIYYLRLAPQRVLAHYQDWTQKHRPALIENDQAVALYLFGEESGNVVHNQLSSALDLIIPARYMVLRPAFLSLPWRHYHATWSYWGDVGVNIVGFVPFGFFFFAYFSAVRGTNNPAISTILLGFLTTLTIEVLQAYLPTRDSGMNDLITNTLGTALGVLLYRNPLPHLLVIKVASLPAYLRPTKRSKIEMETSV